MIYPHMKYKAEDFSVDLEKKAEPERKYKSIWHVLNCSNHVEDKYNLIEYLIDKIIEESKK